MQKPFVVDLSACQTVDHLAVALGVDSNLLAALASAEITPYYRRHLIPKRSRHQQSRSRIVFEPATEELRQVHKTISRRLSAYASHRDPSFPPECCYGFVRKRSTLENADRHKGNELLLRVDIADFFPSIVQGRVADVFLSIDLKLECAQLLSRVLCFNGALVPGLSASPLVANLACRSLDVRLLSLANEAGATYTRYADDLSFSGDTVPTLVQVASALEAEGFSIAEKKHRLTKRGQAHFVTGLSIQDPMRPHVPKKMKRKLRQALYYSEKHSIQDHLLKCGKKMGHGVNYLDGMVRYVSHIEKGTAFDFRKKWEQLQARDDMSPSVGSDYGKERRNYFVAVDETIIETKTKRFIAVGFVLYQDEKPVDVAVQETRDAYLADSFAPGKKGDIARQGLHYADAHAHLRAKFIERLPGIPMRVLVGIAELAGESNQAKAEAYLRIFRWGFANICGRADHGALKLFIEAAPFIMKADVENAMASLYAVRKAANISRPAVMPEVAFVGKSFAAISLPDFMLGVLGTYVKERECTPGELSSSGVAVGHFERLRDRFSLIHDVDTGRYYSRRKPFNAGSLDDRSNLIPAVL
ncbi:reverse transcriptase family protein [Rhodanobacter sp. BL-MT-08]